MNTNYHHVHVFFSWDQPAWKKWRRSNPSEVFYLRMTEIPESRNIRKTYSEIVHWPSVFTTLNDFNLQILEMCPVALLQSARPPNTVIRRDEHFGIYIDSVIWCLLWYKDNTLSCRFYQFNLESHSVCTGKLNDIVWFLPRLGNVVGCGGEGLGVRRDTDGTSLATLDWAIYWFMWLLLVIQTGVMRW